MISSSTAIKKLFKQSSSIKIDVGCTVEYNINTMVNFASNAITNSSVEYTNGGKYPFRKLFPVDSIIKPFRPYGAGVKYYIVGEPTGSNPKTVDYKPNYRIYYPGTDTYYKYWLSKKDGATDIAIKYPQVILTNKITVRFEISHNTPNSWTISGRNGNGSFATLLSGSTGIIPFTTNGEKNYDAGTLNIYYTGTGWSLDEDELDSSSYVSLTDIKLQVPAYTNGYIGVIEIAPKLVKDISDDIVGFDIRKEASSNIDDIIPVGFVSANSLSLELAKYDPSELKYKLFNKTITTFGSDKVYLYKNAELRPYFKIYTTSSQYEKIPQGIFYMNDWSISEYGDISITALDSAKILMETTCPDVLLKDYSATSIIRTLLDNIGFTNYKMNLNYPGGDKTKEESIISPKYWWTEDTKTVWQAIQELCRDIQMTAFFDEYNVLQFYTRDYFYGDEDKSVVWQFSNQPFTWDGTSNLPNIIDLSKEELPKANKVKILWSSAGTSNYIGDSSPLWKSDITYLGAAEVVDDIPYNIQYALGIPPSSNGNAYISLDPIVPSKYINPQSIYSFEGYFLIDSEVIEYDAIEYQYKQEGLESASGWILVDIKDQSDIFKYRTDAAVNPEFFKPSGRYRVKSRGAFNTTPSSHTGVKNHVSAPWKSYEVNWI